MGPGRPRIDIDDLDLRSGSATAIARRLHVSVDTVLSRQREAGIYVRRQGHRDWPQREERLLPGWMFED
jgi:hypothetical protein